MVAAVRAAVLEGQVERVVEVRAGAGMGAAPGMGVEGREVESEVAREGGGQVGARA